MRCTGSQGRSTWKTIFELRPSCTHVIWTLGGVHPSRCPCSWLWDRRAFPHDLGLNSLSFLCALVAPEREETILVCADIYAKIEGKKVSHACFPCYQQRLVGASCR